MRFAVLAALLLPSPALALEYCEELWFTRNLEFHRAGHCFGSALGKAVFGTEGCTGSAELSAAALARVGRVREEEAKEGCKIDTSATSLPIPLIEVRKALADPPFPSLFESGCIGWKPEGLALRSGRSAETPESGRIETGDVLLFQFEDAGDWSFVEVLRGSEVVSLGWAQIEWTEDSCENFAG